MCDPGTVQCVSAGGISSEGGWKLADIFATMKRHRFLKVNSELSQTVRGQWPCHLNTQSKPGPYFKIKRKWGHFLLIYFVWVFHITHLRQDLRARSQRPKQSEKWLIILPISPPEVQLLLMAALINCHKPSALANGCVSCHSSRGQMY